MKYAAFYSTRCSKNEIYFLWMDESLDKLINSLSSFLNINYDDFMKSLKYLDSQTLKEFIKDSQNIYDWQSVDNLCSFTSLYLLFSNKDLSYAEFEFSKNVIRCFHHVCNCNSTHSIFVCRVNDVKNLSELREEIMSFSV